MTMKNKILSIVLLVPLLLTGCDSLFDEGDVRKIYDGPDQVEFFPLQDNVSAAGGTVEVEVQLISSNSNGSGSDITVNLGTEGTAVSGTHFTLAATSVTIPAGSFSATATVNLIAGSVPAGGEVLLTLTMDSVTGAEAATNLSSSSIFITE